MDISALNQQFHSGGYSFSIFNSPPGHRWMGLVHSVDEMVFLLDGCAIITVASFAHCLDIGEKLIIPAYEIHDVITDDEIGCLWAYGYKHP